MLGGNAIDFSHIRTYGGPLQRRKSMSRNTQWIANGQPNAFFAEI
jgi:hypothetical protein